MRDSKQPWYALNQKPIQIDLATTPVKTNALTQISSELHHQMHQLQAILPPASQKQLQRLSRRIASKKGWFLGSLSLVLLWVLIWQWFLSIAVGLGVMSGVYLAQQGRLRFPWQGWRKLVNRSNRSLTLSALAGFAALGSTYLATAVWVEADQHWLATSILLEGLGILAIGSFLVWQFFSRRTPIQFGPETQFQQWLGDFSHADPLKRLIAVRQTTRAVTAAHLPLPMTVAELADCFRLMLDRETEAVVCNALIESLQMLNTTRQLEGTQLSPVTMRSPAKTKVAQQFSTED